MPSAIQADFYFCGKRQKLSTVTFAFKIAEHKDVMLPVNYIDVFSLTHMVEPMKCQHRR